VQPLEQAAVLVLGRQPLQLEEAVRLERVELQTRGAALAALELERQGLEVQDLSLFVIWERNEELVARSLHQVATQSTHLLHREHIRHESLCKSKQWNC